MYIYLSIATCRTSAASCFVTEVTINSVGVFVAPSSRLRTVEENASSVMEVTLQKLGHSYK